MQLNNNCFVVIQVMQRRRREDGHQTISVISKMSARIIRDHHLLLVIFVFVLVNPLSATPLFSPCSFARAALVGLVVYKPRGRNVAKPKICRKAPVRQCTIGTSPLSIRWWILEVVHSIFSCHRVSPDLSAMASPTLVMDPSDMARRE
jgi:hypothetical protein